MVKLGEIRDTSFGIFFADLDHSGMVRGFVVVILMRRYTKTNT
jgi:hypothetical protein